MFQNGARTRLGLGFAALSILTLGLFSVSAPAQEPANTVAVTFILQFDISDLPDRDHDGIPELPNLNDDEYKLILFEEQLNFADTLAFSNASPPCGVYSVAGLNAVTDSRALVIHRGRPYSVWVYRFNYGSPDYRSVLSTKEIVHTESCWAADSLYGNVRVQPQFDVDTSRCLAFVTAMVDQP